MSSLLEAGRSGEALTSLEVIDMHGHLGCTGYPTADDSAAGLVRTMDRLGIATCLVAHMGCLSHRVSKGNDLVMDAIAKWPGRIMGYATVWPADSDAVRAEVLRCLDGGMTGIKLHDANGFAYDDGAYESAYRIADERGLPVLFHTWGKPEEFEQIAAKAKEYPRASFILAHAGCLNEEGYIKIARDAENVWLDLCLSSCHRGLVERLVGALGAGKILWGSDAVFINVPQQLGKVLGASIAEEDKIKLLSTNAKWVLSRIGGGGASAT